MSVKLRAGSMELEAAFIEWLRTRGYNPADGVEPFFNGSEFVRTQMPMIHESEKEQRLEEARHFLQRRSADPAFAGQFPMVYRYQAEGRTLRYTITLTLSDEGAEWVGRIWEGDDYLGEVLGSDSGPHANYLDLARVQVESGIGSAGAMKRQKI
ncbi:MAG: hypothetical protein ABWZ08_01470 [Pseudoxanthomonas sp.]